MYEEKYTTKHQKHTELLSIQCEPLILFKKQPSYVM